MFNQQHNYTIRGGSELPQTTYKEVQQMLQKFRIAKEKNKLKLNLLKHANSNLETSNNPELLRAVAELLKEINR